MGSEASTLGEVGVLKKLLKVLAIIASPFLLIAAIIWFQTDSYTLRYRLTLYATVDGKPVQGSGVIQVHFFRPPYWLLDNPNTSAYLKGEAVTLDLGNKGSLFALLVNRMSSPSCSPGYIVPCLWGKGDFVKNTLSLREMTSKSLSAIGGKRNENLALLPLLVRFRDINDPATVEQVDPYDLAASFGEGVVLTKATIEITHDPITGGLSEKLSWLPPLVAHDETLAGGTNLSSILGHTLPEKLIASDFIRGE